MEKSDQWQLRLAARYPEIQAGEENFFNQWTHTGQFRDHGKPIAVCDLCGNRGLRYHFLVAHRQTGEAIWVGSQCVLNFDLSEGAMLVRQRQARQVTEEAAKVEANQTQLIHMLSQLQGIYQLASKQEQRQIRWMVGKFQQRGGFSPADLGWLFAAMLASGHQLDPASFPLILRAKKDRQELHQLSISALNWLKPALTEKQCQKIAEMGIRL
ncbi:MAG: hypothetical protein JW757_14140 [Anaerolineales bacterium]|nr:hypothetical protein [Anaerolineales bacterium]